MAVNQVVLYFDKPQDAVLFTLAASAVMSQEAPPHSSRSAAGRSLKQQRASIGTVITANPREWLSSPHQSHPAHGGHRSTLNPY